MRGKFITFEGSEGCGKSTQSRLLYEFLKKKGCAAVYLREPGGTRIGERIRKILLDPRNHIGPEAEMLLYMAARAELVEKVIQPNLLKGKIIVCDRFLDSTLAYQGFGLGLDIAMIKRIGDFVTADLEPDLTIFLDLAVKKGLAYRRSCLDRIEKRPISYHSRVRKGYLKLAKYAPRRIKVIRVEKDKSLTQDKIRKLVVSVI